MTAPDDMKRVPHPRTMEALKMQAETAEQRGARKMLEARRAAGKELDKELRHIEPFVDPLPSFTRGVQFGAAICAAWQLFAPGFFGTDEWPQWVRAFIGMLFLVVAAHLLMRQRGFMLAQRINRGMRP